MPSARLVSIQVGKPKTLAVEDPADPTEQTWTTGSFKEPVVGPIWLGRTNLAGDGQADLKNHGGPDKAVCVYSADHLPRWAAELERPQAPPGSFSENFTLAGITEEDVCIGDVFAVGEARVQVSQPRQPCWKLARRWGVEDMIALVVDSGRTGWYFRVLLEGHVAPGQELLLVDRPLPAWTVARANDVMYRRHDDPQAAELAYSPFLSLSWRRGLQRRLHSRANRS